MATEFVRVGALADFPRGCARVISVGRKPLAMFNVDGTLHAINNICPHLGGPLGAGELEGCEVSCPYHGMPFDVTTGESADGFGHAVQVYRVKVEADAVWVEMWWAKKKH